MRKRDENVSPKPVDARTFYLTCNGEDFQFLSELPVMCDMLLHLSQHKLDQECYNIIITFWKCLLFHSKLLAFTLFSHKQETQDICILYASMFVKLCVYGHPCVCIFVSVFVFIHNVCVCMHMYLSTSLHVCTIID